jgi:hypothetical protein
MSMQPAEIQRYMTNNLSLFRENDTLPGKGKCHLVFHRVTFSLNSQGVSISLNNNKGNQGKRILISHVYETGKNLEEVVLVPTSQETFAFDAPLAGFLLF